MRNHVGVAYRELPPPPALAPLVRCLWIHTGTAEETLVLPDGCVDVVVRDGHAAIAGPHTGPMPVTLGHGEVVTGVRFHPGAAGAALGVPADALRDRRADLADLWGSRAAAAVGSAGVGDPLALARAVAPRCAEVPLDPRMRFAARVLGRAPATPVPVLAGAVGLGERHLRRRFAEAVGYGPKTFARIVRFRAALGLVRGGFPLASAALAAGYADQAHMTREMRSLAGRSPGALAGG